MSTGTPRRLLGALFILILSILGASPSLATPPADSGGALYSKYCALCHGTQLEGYAADNAPSLSSPTFRNTASTAFLQAAIERGRAGTAMAGYGKAVGGPLEPAEVDTLIAFIRGDVKAPALLPPKASKGDGARGASVYTAHCQTCHGTVEQRGNAVHLANPMFLATASDAYLRVAIVEGRPGTAMDPWRDKLSGREIEDVIAYVRSLARPVPLAPAVATLPVANAPTAIVMNPKGKPPDFPLHLGRYASVADVAKAYGEKRRFVLIDARPTSDYLRMHIPGAISIPYFEMRDLDKVPNDGTWVVAYCVCPHEESGRVLEELRKRGYANTAILDEGLFVWNQQGYPIAAAAGQLPIAAPPAKAVPFLPMPLPSNSP